MVFQDYALYPHMTVAENIGFGLKMRGTPRPRRRARVAEVAESCRSSTCSTASRGSSPAGSASASRSAARSCASRRSSSSTSRSPTSTPAARRVRTEIKRLHRAWAHHGLRHPRPGRGDDAGRPHRAACATAASADRHPRRALRAPGQPLRRRLHGLADDELPPARLVAEDGGPAHRPRRRPPAAGARQPRRALRPPTPAARSSSACARRISPTPGPTNAARARRRRRSTSSSTSPSHSARKS